MTKYQHLPTLTAGKWTITSFRDSFIDVLNSDSSSRKLSMYFYAVTKAGWDQVRNPILRWKGNANERRVTLYVGTDHALTDPSALEQISEDGVSVRLLVRYSGVFHPKVLWLRGKEKHIAWVGSNNLTRDGLQNNIEFALLVEAGTVPEELHRWAKLVREGSEKLTPALLRSYEKQRREFEAARAQAKLTTFTWRKRREPAEDVESDILVVEVMPKETGGDGRQLQLPMKAAREFFGVGGVDSSKEIDLKAKHDSVKRQLTMRVFRNKTVRLVVSDLEYRDRPCVLVFRRLAGAVYEYEIVSESIFPSRYRSYLKLCTKRTRAGSRRWGIV